MPKHSIIFLQQRLVATKYKLEQEKKVLEEQLVQIEAMMEYLDDAKKRSTSK